MSKLSTIAPRLVRGLKFALVPLTCAGVAPLEGVTV